jgi:hypothetical protein
MMFWSPVSGLRILCSMWGAGSLFSAGAPVSLAGFCDSVLTVVMVKACHYAYRRCAHIRGTSSPWPDLSVSSVRSSNCQSNVVMVQFQPNKHQTKTMTKPCIDSTLHQKEICMCLLLQNHKGLKGHWRWGVAQAQEEGWDTSSLQCEPHLVDLQNMAILVKPLVHAWSYMNTAEANYLP